MNEPSLSDLLQVAMEAAHLGGCRTLGYFNTGLAPEWKADGTPVTLADREAERVIREHLARHFPTHSVLGEELGEQAGTAGGDKYRWIIDPIDGTKSFICGVPLYGTLIGVEVAGRPAVGVVYMPALEEMVSAAVGLGCRWNGRPCRVSSVAKLCDAVVLCTNGERASARGPAWDKIVAGSRIQRGWGDCYGYVLVATGRADVMFDPAMKPWDCAPLLPIMQEAGGTFSDWQGNATIWGPDAFATNGKLFAEVLGILNG